MAAAEILSNTCCPHHCQANPVENLALLLCHLTISWSWRLTFLIDKLPLLQQLFGTLETLLPNSNVGPKPGLAPAASMVMPIRPC